MNRSSSNFKIQITGNNRNTHNAHRENFLPGVLVPHGSIPTSRSKRSPDDAKFTEFVHHIRTIARIANGATLVNGLVGGTISGNDVVTELLHMGSLTPEKVIAMKEEDVTQITEPLSEFGANLVENQNVKKLEDNFIALNHAINDVQRFEAVKMLGSKVLYESVLGKLKSTKINGTAVKAPFDHASKLLNSLKGVSGLQEKHRTDAKEAVREVEKIKNSSLDLGESLGKYDPVVDVVNDLKSLEVLSSFVKLLVDETTARKDVMTNKGSYDEVDANFKLFGDTSVELGAHREAIELLNSFAMSRQRAPYRSLNHTAGFRNGRENLDSLEIDVSSTAVWLPSVNGTEKTAKAIKKALKPLDELNSNMKSVEETWEPINQKIKSAKAVLSIVRDLPEDKNAVTSVLDMVDEFKRCHGGNLPVPLDINEIQVVRQLIDRLNTAVRRFSNFEYVEDLKNLHALLAATTYNAIYEDGKVQETPTKLAELGQLDLDDIIRKLELFKKDMTELEPIVSGLSSTVNGILAKQYQIGTFHQKVKKFDPLLECLKPIGQNGKLVTSMIATIRAVRAMKSTREVPETIDFIKTVKSSSPALATTLKTAGDMRKLTEREVKSLSEFQKESASQILGLAAQGMTVIQEVNGSRQKLDALTGDVQYILDAADRHSAVADFSEHFRHLKSFDSLKANLTEMFTEIDSVTSTVRQLKGTNLKSTAPVFTAAGEIKPVKINIETLKSAVIAVKQLDPNLQSQLVKVSAALDTLDQLDLDFVRYNFSSAPGALADLEQYFANWNRIVSAFPEDVAVRNSKQRQTLSDGEKAAVDRRAIVAIVICVVIGLLVTLLLCIFHRRKMREKLEKLNKLVKRKTKKRSTTVEDSEAMTSLLMAMDQLIVQLETSSSSLITPRQQFAHEIELFDKIAKLQKDNAFNQDYRAMRRCDDIYCLKDSAALIDLTAVRDDVFRPGFIHANNMEMKFSTWILAQAPLTGFEPHFDYDADKVTILAERRKTTTIDRHWQLIFKRDVALIVQLCKFEENGVEACPVYYPQQLGEHHEQCQFHLEMVESYNVGDEFTVRRDQYSAMRIKYEYGTAVKYVDILRFFGWEENALLEPEPPLEIIRFIDKYKGKTIMVHCSTGTGRTGMLAGINKGLEMCQKSLKPGLEAICSALRESRCQALQNEIQVAYVMLVMAKSLVIKTNNTQFIKSYAALKWYYDQMVLGRWLKTAARPGKDGSKPKPEVITHYRDKQEALKDIEERNAFVDQKQREWEGRNKTRTVGKEKQGTTIETSSETSKTVEKETNKKEKSSINNLGKSSSANSSSPSKTQSAQSGSKTTSKTTATS